MTDKPAERTVNMVHYPLQDATDPNALDVYLDGIDSSISTIEGDITTIEGDITTIQGDITALGSLTSYTPTPTSATGTLTGATSNMVYSIIGKMMFLSGNILPNDITTGSAGGYCQFTLPASKTAELDCVIRAATFTPAHHTLSFFFYADASYCRIYSGDGTTFQTPFFADDDKFTFSGIIPIN